MGGLLNGLSELLKGFNTVDRFKKEGFDYRQKEAAQQAARDQELQNYQQANEDWATKAATEADIGAPEGTDITSLIPSQVGDTVTRQRIAARAKGAGMQSKSYLKAQDLANRQATDRQKQLDALARQDDQQAFAVELETLREKNRSGRKLSPAELDRQKWLEGQAELNRLNARTVAGMRGSGGTGGGKPQRVATPEGYAWLYPPDEENPEGRLVQTGVKQPPTSVERTRQEQAGNVIEQGQSLLERLKGPVRGMIGPGAGWWSKAKDIVGETPPEVRQLKTDISSLAAFMPILHGARGGGNMISHFEDVIGNPFKYDADQIGSAVYALMEAADRIQRVGPGADISDIGQRYGFGSGSAPARPGGARTPTGGTTGAPPRPSGVPPEAKWDAASRRWRM